MAGILKVTDLLDGTRSGVLFVCQKNDALSQMAEGFARFLSPSDIAVHSAGESPAQVDAYAVSAMKEVGIDISNHRAKGLAEIPLDAIAVAVALCGIETCPALPGHIKLLDWPLDAPRDDDGEPVHVFRRARDQVRELVSALF